MDIPGYVFLASGEDNTYVLNDSLQTAGAFITENKDLTYLASYVKDLNSSTFSFGHSMKSSFFP